MKKATANETYGFAAFNDEQQYVLADSDDADIFIDQSKGDVLEVWKERDDGFYFVYSNELELGYWVHPRLITVSG